MLQSHYNKTVIVKRLRDDSGNTEIYDVHLAAVPCLIQPLDDSFTQDIEGNFGEESLMICDPCDILEGDLIIDGASKYRVVGCKVNEFLEQSHHMELRIRISQK